MRVSIAYSSVIKEGELICYDSGLESTVGYCIQYSKGMMFVFVFGLGAKKVCGGRGAGEIVSIP